MTPPLPALDALDAVLFDAGGTLVHIDYAFVSRRAAELGTRVTAEALGRGESVARLSIERETRTHGRVPGTDASRRARYFGHMLEAAGVPPTQAAKVAEAIDADHVDDNLWRVALPGAAETLAGLRERGLRTAVVSNADGRIEAILERAGLAVHLDLVVDSHVEGVEKPDPEIFARALARLGVSAARAMYVGDIYAIDARGARAAGIAPVVIDVYGGYADLDCATIATLPELLGTHS